MNKKALFLGLFLALFVQACGDSTSSKVPSRLVISPFTSNMASLGESVQYSARLEDKKGVEIPGAVFTWSVGSAQVASITSSGLLTGLKAGETTVSASAEGISGNASVIIHPVPDQLMKVAGDQQLGVLRQVLPTQVVVEVLDANSNPVQGKFVTFSVLAGGGTASPWQVQTGADGLASTVWQLGCSNDNPQRLKGTVEGLTVEFTANVDLNALAICQLSVPEGRETQSYSAQIEAAGGNQSSLSWEIVGGTLPPGLILQTSGELGGTPTQAGNYSFTARVQDGSSGQATGGFNLRVCEAPILLDVGGRTTLDPTGEDGCGFFLPAGDDGDRYRFGVVYTRGDDNDENDVPTVSVQMSREAGGAVASESLLSETFLATQGSPVGPRMAPDAAERLREDLSIAQTTQAFHYRVREAEKELIRSLGPNARPLPDRSGAARAAGPALASPEKMTFSNASELTSCELGETRRAVLVKENELMVIYQDSIQRATEALPDAQAQALLDHYAAYGKQVIDGYFGGVSDINNDGKIVVFVSPKVESGVAAYVWSGDFFPKTAEPGWSGCEASNEMEMMRFSLSVLKGVSEGNFQALGTAVHETKHISSLYKGLMRSSYFDTYYQPSWIEEGTAEISEERAARIAWSMTGGPGIGAMADADDVRALPSFTKEMYSTILVNAGAKGYLSSQPNSVVLDPLGASEIHSIYGSGWHFHRWLGDAFGNAAQPLADTTFFRMLNDSVTATGVAGILSVTGAPSWGTLLEDYAVAIMLNGTAAPQGPRSFSSYDFPSFHTTFEYTTAGAEPPGNYPWPVNVVGESPTSAFATASSIGPIGPSGIRVFDLTSNGTGLGIMVKVSTDIRTQPFRIVLVRLQ